PGRSSRQSLNAEALAEAPLPGRGDEHELTPRLGRQRTHGTTRQTVMAPITLFGCDFTMPKGYLTGTHRTRSPRQTLEDYARWMPPRGIARVATRPGSDPIGLPVYTAIRPNARSLATSQGKGCDADSARASALMECIENWHGERIDKPLRWESYMALCDAVP